ncbi:MAG: UDP-N-acetylmuramoyl-L-alanine--D-glutamate ligase [Solirubrobacterales bacterium]|nr:UDP-N-acetylmuramoyl-L-alanine--D-glutamate ligase [Solirubrobacterales bacterium]
MGDGLDLLDGVGAVVKSPGVPPRAPVVAAARERGIPVLGELELGWRLVDVPFVAVTGTNGKTTVTEWLAHTLRLAGLDVAAAGNVGTPLTSLVPAPPELVVCECSSYQLADTLEFAPEVGILLNLGSDHLDWHGSLEHYAASKLRLFAHQEPEHVAIAPARVAVPGRARRMDLVPDWRASLPGGHNAVNAGAVAEACRALGVAEEVVQEGLRTFAGVEHRLELLREVGGVRWINDSKATNVASTLTALDATPPPVHLILGGDDAKQEDFTPLAGRAAHVYLVGEAAGRLAEQVGGERCGDLETAVARAAAAARPGETVLLSPACASFDQFKDYEERGRRFAALVEALA